MLLLQFGISAILRKAESPLLQNSQVMLLISSVTTYGVAFPITYFLVKNIPATAPERHRITGGRWVLAAIMSFPLVFGSNLIGVFLTFLIGLVQGGTVQNNMLEVISANSEHLLLLFVLVVVIAPVLEELWFRKLLIDRLTPYGQGVCVLVSGLMFALYHGNLNQFVYALTLGMFFAFLYVKTGNVRVTIGLHMLVNFVGSILPLLVMRISGIEEMFALVNDPAALTAYLMEHMGGYMIYLGYVLLVYGAALAGFILFIVFRKRFTLNPGTNVIPAGKRFATIFVNIGMAVFVLIYIGLIVKGLIV